MEQRRLTDLEKIELCRLYETGNYTFTSLAKKYGVTLQAIKGLLNRRGYKSKSQSELQKKYFIDERFFDEIDTEEKAYFLGFLYADGYNDEKGIIHLTLQEKDVEILKKLKKIIKSDKPLRYIKKNIGQNAYSLNIENKHISNKLKELGCTKGKSLTLQFPEWLDEKLYNHFIRGYFDGDGSIGKYQNIKYNNYNYVFTLEGNKDFLEMVQNILIKKFNFNKTKFYQKHKGRKSSVSLRYCGREQLNIIMEWLYKDANIYMERKYNEWKNLKM